MNGFFDVPKGNGGVRPILNLADDSEVGESLNAYIKIDDPEACNVEYIQQLEIIERIRSVGKGGWLWCKDLKWGFNNLPIARRDTRYLAFEFDKKKWCYQVMPMGLTSAPNFFTEFMFFPIWAIKDANPDIFYLTLPKEEILVDVFRKDSDIREEGENVIISLIDNYLDDIFGGHPDKLKALLQSDLVDRKLIELGLEAQTEKQKGPSQSIDLLGKNYNTITQRVKLTEKHYKKYTTYVEAILSEERVTVKTFLKVIGKLRYAGSIYRPLNAFVRSLEKWVHTKKNRRWFKGVYQLNLRSWINITKPVRRDFVACLRMLKMAHEKGASFESFRMNKGEEKTYDVTIYTDASGSDKLGIGGIASTGEYYQNRWSDIELCEEGQKDIQWRELVGVFVMIAAMRKQWKGKRVHIYTDNNPVKYWLVNRRSDISRQDCQVLINQIAQWEIEEEMYLWFDHIKGEENIAADALSRYYKDPLEKAPFECNKEIDCTNGLRLANNLTATTAYDFINNK